MHGVRAADRNGLSDPYCRVHLAGSVKSTKVVRQDLNAYWNEVFIFPWQQLKTDGCLLFEVWDSNDYKPPDFLGEVGVGHVHDCSSHQSIRVHVVFVNKQRFPLPISLLPLNMPGWCKQASIRSAWHPTTCVVQAALQVAQSAVADGKAYMCNLPLMAERRGRRICDGLGHVRVGLWLETTPVHVSRVGIAGDASSLPLVLLVFLAQLSFFCQ